MSLLRNERIIVPPLQMCILLIGGAVMIAYLTVFGTVLNGPKVLTIIVGLSAMVLIILRYMWGIYLIFLMSIFMFYIQRIVPLDFPIGVVYDLLVVLTFISMLVSVRDKPDWSSFLNPITWVFFIMIFYHFMEVFNPHGTFQAWGMSLRKNVWFLLYLLGMQAVLTTGGLRKLTIAWIGLALVVALYGIYQEIFGLTDAEWEWIYGDPERYSIYFVWGNMRKFSFLSDPSAYGNFMAAGGLACLVFAIRLPRFSNKVLFGALAVIMLLAMSYSGTRTAYAMVGVGLAFYLLLTMRSAKTMAIATMLALVVTGIFFGPFHGWQINRIRSAFNASDDPSMSVRDDKRLRYQPYIQSHPIGGGVFTTASFGKSYAPDHEFAGVDPDSGYLETAMESGWIGLVILLFLLFVTVYRGVDNYFTTINPLFKTIILVYLVPFFALSIGHFAQNALFAKPVDFMVLITMSIMAQAPRLDKVGSV